MEDGRLELEESLETNISTLEPMVRNSYYFRLHFCIFIIVLILEKES